jgi:hypothetical protein
MQIQPRAKRGGGVMPHLGFAELILILIIGLIKFGIPIAFAVGVIIVLKRILNRLSAIEQRISQGNIS